MDEDDRAVLRWPFWCVVVFILLPICVFGTMNGFDYFFFFFPITFALVGIGFFLTCQASLFVLIAVRRSAWRRCLSAMILPVCVALGVWNFGALWETWRNAGDRLYFERQKSAYLIEIAKQDASNGPRLMVFPGGGWAGVAGRVYVFDESDEILLGEKDRSVDFKRRADATELSCNAVAFPLEGHFYKAFITC